MHHILLTKLNEALDDLSSCGIDYHFCDGFHEKPTYGHYSFKIEDPLFTPDNIKDNAQQIQDLLENFFNIKESNSKIEVSYAPSNELEFYLIICDFSKLEMFPQKLSNHLYFTIAYYSLHWRIKAKLGFVPKFAYSIKHLHCDACAEDLLIKGLKPFGHFNLMREGDDIFCRGVYTSSSFVDDVELLTISNLSEVSYLGEIDVTHINV